MVGEISEDGRWIWDGADWNPYTSRKIPDLNDKEGDIIVYLSASKTAFVEEERLGAIILSLAYILIWILIDSSEYGEGGDNSSSFFVDICFYPFFCFLGLFPILLVRLLINPSSDHSCGKCSLHMPSAEIFKGVKTKVLSTTSSTKAITTSNPQISAGSFGGKGASFVTMASTTSHVPVVLGRISANYTCPNESCGAVNEWTFNTEVQAWTNEENNEVTYEIIGSITLPKFS